VSPLERPDSKLAAFVFKAQLAETAVSRLDSSRPRSGELTYEVIAEKLSLSQLDARLVASAKKMSAVYTAIAAFENMVREIISDRMLEEVGETWWESDAVSADIRKRAAKRQEEEKQNRWHSPRGVSPVYFAEMKDLVTIIASNWDRFTVLLGDVDWVRSTIRSLERSRNVIMHSGELSLEDIQRVGGIIRDWIRQVGA
jgi:hypothetical protein